MSLTEREKAISLYGNEFVEKVERGREAYKAGKTSTYTLEEIEEQCK